MTPPQIIFVDNRDSFVFNLVDEFARRGCAVSTYRNDACPEALLAHARTLPAPRLFVLSPGPGRPADAGCCPELVARGEDEFSFFGVCLGLQVIVEALGGEVAPAGEVVHGKNSLIDHDATGLFAGCPRPLTVARYHSLAARRLPDRLRVTARAADTPMAVTHRARPIAAVQFHPESILTPDGGRILEHAIALAR